MTSALAGLGRLVSKDHRDHNFLLPRRSAADDITYKFWTDSRVLDQKDTPECVGYSSYGWLLAYPVINRPKFTAEDLYGYAQANDEWAGTTHDGSSVRGAFKALQLMGFVKSYGWAVNINTMLDHILVVGPLVAGTDWHEGMFTGDKNDFIDDIGGTVAGGHAYLLIGADRNIITPHGTKGAFRVQNSWGENWCDDGRAWLSFDAFAELLKNDGEACTALELQVTK